MSRINLLALVFALLLPGFVVAQETAGDKSRPQITYSSFVQLKGKVAGRDAYMNKAGTFAALRIVHWSRAGQDEVTKEPKFKAHFTSIVAFGDQAKELSELKKGDRILIQGQVDMIPQERRYKGKNGTVGDSHRLIARYVEKLAAKAPPYNPTTTAKR